MELTTDVLLKGRSWNNTIDALSPIFKTRTHYSIYILCMSIGIMYDQVIEELEETDGETVKSIPRNVLQNQDNGKLDFMFQAAILSTKTENFSEEKRLDLAFGDKPQDEDFNKMRFLTRFANFGVTKLEEQIGDTPVESMENIKSFLTSTIEGNNFDINAIPDEIWLEDF